MELSSYITQKQGKTIQETDALILPMQLHRKQESWILTTEILVS